MAGVYRAVCWFRGSLVTRDLVSSEIYIVLGPRAAPNLAGCYDGDTAVTRRLVTVDGRSYFRLPGWPLRNSRSVRGPRITGGG